MGEPETKSENRRRVVITGMGVVTPLGNTIKTFWRRLLRGESAVAPISRFDASKYPVRIAAEAAPSDPASPPGAPSDSTEFDRISLFAETAALQAVTDAGLPDSQDYRDSTGVCLALGLGNYGHHEIFSAVAAGGARGEDFDWNAFARQLRVSFRPNAAERRTPGAVPARLARRLRLRGPVMAVMTACAGGSQALGDACRWIRSGQADVVIAGGADSEIYPMGLASFCLLGALSKRNHDPQAASRPFDLDRDGFVLGEGAGVVVLEEAARARRRGAKVYAEISGFGGACDAYRVTDPHPEGKGAILAMRRALADAGVAPDRVGYVNAHGTSTLLNDRIEAAAIHAIFGGAGALPAVSSTKSMIGHLTVAAGAVEAIVTALSLASQTVHPTINYSTPDPACDLDCVPDQSRPLELEYAMSNSFAFGGQCASLLLSRFGG